MKTPVSLAVVLLASALFVGRAQAQVSDIAEPGFSVERLWLAPGTGGFLAAQSARLLQPGQWSIAVLGSLMKDPIVLSDLQSGEAVSKPVERRLGYELAIARSVNSRLQMGVAIPVVAAQHGDRLRGIGLSEEALEPLALADIRLHAKLRLQPDARAPFAYGLDMHVALPTGDEENFAGERGAVLSWTMIASYRVGAWRMAGNMAFRMRTQEVILLSPARPHGNEVIVTVAGEYSLPPSWDVPLGVLAEITQVSGDGGGASPGEVRGGIVAHLLRHARLKFVGGAGYTPDEVGAPAWRLAVLFERTTPSY